MKMNQTNNSPEIRLQKYLSSCGVMSRRAAEKAIENGNIYVNGIKATLGMSVNPKTDKVVYMGKEIIPSEIDNKIYIMLNKPAGYVTTLNDEKNRKTALDLLTGIQERVYPIGRLDMFSDGLLLFTNDGKLTNQLTHPSHHISKVYRLFVKGLITEEKINEFKSPMVLDGYKIQPVETKIENTHLNLGGTPCSSMLVTLHEGRNRQIRKMCEKVDLTVIKLTRIAQGEIELGDLPIGKYRYLNQVEIQYLKSIE